MKRLEGNIIFSLFVMFTSMLILKQAKCLKVSKLSRCVRNEVRSSTLTGFPLYFTIKRAHLTSTSIFCIHSDDNMSDLSSGTEDSYDSKRHVEQVQFGENEFTNLGIFNEISLGLEQIKIKSPTTVQAKVVPRLLNNENILMAASTGSGKTLSYILPTIQKLLVKEQRGYIRKIKRPRVLILVPTRELARQVLSNIKSISHYCKVSSCAVVGGEQYGLQKKNLNRLVDVVVASPGRLRQHKDQGHIYFSQIDTVIIDEVDTMLTQGFGPDMRAILRSAMFPSSSIESGVNDEGKPQLIMATATLTRAVRTLITDLEGGFDINYTDSTNLTPQKRTKANMEESKVDIKVVEIEGLHKVLSNVKHYTVAVPGGQDKMAVLRDILSRFNMQTSTTLIFCNSVSSCQAVAYFLNEAGIETISYHGDLNSRMRDANLRAFREGLCQYLVCTDIAARGLDISDVEHVIMFDFPLNSIDYLHRAGRCGRAGRSGFVTSIVAKRDQTLSEAIQNAIKKDLPLDNLTSDKKDYSEKGPLSHVNRAVVTKRKSSSRTKRNGKMEVERPLYQKLSKRRGI